MKKLLILAACLALFCQCKEKEAPYDLSEHIGVCMYPVTDENGAAMKDAGYAYQEIAIKDYLDPFKSNEEWEETCIALLNNPMPIYSGCNYFPGSLKLVGPDADLEKNLEFAELAMRRANKIGLKILVLGSGGARRIPEGFPVEEARAQFIELCKGLGEIGEKFQITVVIEPLFKKGCNFINTVREATAIAKEVDSPYVAVLADFFHMAQEGEDAGAIVEAGALLKHCHISESEGTAPGVKGDDFGPYLRALKEIGYKGCISLECDWDKEAPLAPQLAAAFKYTKESIDHIYNN